MATAPPTEQYLTDLRTEIEQEAGRIAHDRSRLLQGPLDISQLMDINTRANALLEKAVCPRRALVPQLTNGRTIPVPSGTFYRGPGY